MLTESSIAPSQDQCILYGPITFIIHCEFCFEILIVFLQVLCTIPTASDFYDRANKLRDELAEAWGHGLDSEKYKVSRLLYSRASTTSSTNQSLRLRW